jgi:lipoprotein-anchoring transpeptidase ErfK/SrfK
MENENLLIEGSTPEKEKISKIEPFNSATAKTGDTEGIKGSGTGNLLRVFRKALIVVGTILLIFGMVLFILYGVPVIKEFSPGKTEIILNEEQTKDPQYKKQVAILTKEIQKLSVKYNSYTSGQSYIVINTTENKFSLYTNKKLVREGFCSTGSLTMLKTEKGDKFWVFKTPKGKRSINGKITNPSWNRPDWSFVEEGLPIPPRNSPARYESGVLGDYAMSIGDGYLIHGTLYKRFLGMPVTHGCVRLNDEDLKAVYHTLNIGSKVYIF